ncbi:uncharacterized protein BJ212DRAFT_1550540 [Suillus subaureus]|uniref:Uncharacterized protein n=1 Tax=Suillus subaureus TaxID=48587 RepID=A0A9P7EHU8_9AGAM|nr:uncharacterized protein BJ212DRAFT_1550540 [Suillus subaureus]KAG1821078.1 hypothetical protein BJ212DRAFT_1550540 [Suillus subaureus]
MFNAAFCWRVKDGAAPRLLCILSRTGALEPQFAVTSFWVNSQESLALTSVIFVTRFSTDIGDLQGIFLARACAIWGLRRRVIAMFLISGLLYVATGHVVLSVSRSAPKIIKSPIRIASCFETGEGSTIIIVYVILAVAEIQIWMFTIYKAVASYWREGTHNRLLGQLVLHNMIYVTCGLIILATAFVEVSSAKDE